MTNPNTDADDDLDRIISRVIRVVEYNTAPPDDDFQQPKMKQVHIIGILGQANCEPEQVKRALAHAVKRNKLERDMEQRFWIPGRPDGDADIDAGIGFDASEVK